MRWRSKVPLKSSMGHCIQFHIWLPRSWVQSTCGLPGHTDLALANASPISSYGVHIGVRVIRGGSCPEVIHQELEDQDSAWILQCPSLVPPTALLARSVLS